MSYLATDVISHTVHAVERAGKANTHVVVSYNYDCNSLKPIVLMQDQQGEHWSCFVF